MNVVGNPSYLGDNIETIHQPVAIFGKRSILSHYREIIYTDLYFDIAAAATAFPVFCDMENGGKPYESTLELRRFRTNE